MHAAELARNEALSDFHVHDLNQAPTLPMYADASFDAVFCSVSVDYLSRPLEVFAEIHRILKPGGLAVFTWSNRMFPTKAISAWRQASNQLASGLPPPTSGIPFQAASPRQRAPTFRRIRGVATRSTW